MQRKPSNWAKEIAEKKAKGAKPNLTIVMIRTFGFNFLLATLYRLVEDCVFRYGQIIRYTNEIKVMCILRNVIFIEELVSRYAWVS